MVGNFFPLTKRIPNTKQLGSIKIWEIWSWSLIDPLQKQFQKEGPVWGFHPPNSKN